jgi:hypothetical protein
MKTKSIILFFLASLFVAACQKDENEPIAATDQEVVFGINELGAAGLKSNLSDYDCPVDLSGNPLVPTVAEIEIEDNQGAKTTYNPQVFYLDGKLYTQSIKLKPGLYNITKFLLKTDIGGDIVMAIPEQGSPFASYVTKSVNFSFEVEAFKKAEIEIEVLCFIPRVYESFGFFWFEITQIVVREFCFFGDLCVKDPTEYVGSLYQNQVTGLQIDMPAIFKMHVFKDGVELATSPFTNATAAAGWGVGAPLCVQFPDNLAIEEEFSFELWILVRTGSTFAYQHFHTWILMDDEEIKDGDDGVVDFVLGNCVYSETDLLLPPYMNLPATANVKVSNPGNPGYWNFTINSVSPAGVYDLPLGQMTGWCGDKNTTMGNNTTWTMHVYSSLYNMSWPTGMPFNETQVSKVNWLFNNIGDFDGFSAPTGMYITSGDFTQAQGIVIQDAIWGIIHGTSGPGSANISGMALNMTNTANILGGGFTPLPGGWAAILFVPNNDPAQAQLVFTMVDP